MYKKEKKLHFEFDKKLNDKGYQKTNNNVNLVSLISSSVVESEEYAARILLSMFPVANLYTFIKIITKKLDNEYNAILDSLDNEEVLDTLEENRHIYNQKSILMRKDNLVNKIAKRNKTDEHNKNTSESIKIGENDSLEQLKQKKELLDEMIYIRSLEEMSQVSSIQEYEENLEQPEKEKQFDKNLENIIRDTCAIKLQLETEKQKLENLSSISNLESVMDDFMKKLGDDTLAHDKEPTTEKELVMNEEFIDEQLENYKKLSELSIMQEIEEPKIEGPRLVKKMTPESGKK